MASVDSRTRISIDELVNGTIVSGHVTDNRLILVTRGGAEIDAGSVATNVVGSQTFSIDFTTAVTPWTCTHNLNSLDPHVVAYEAGGNEVLGDIHIVDANTLTITWAVPLSGSCRITA